MKKALFTLMVCFLLLLTACDQETEDSGASGRTFIGGTTGLSMEFVTGSPPDEVFDQGQQPFAINLKVENKGEWQIKTASDLTMSVTGIDKADFNNPALTQDSAQPLQAARLSTEGNIIPGTISNFFFDGFSYTKPLAGTSQSFPLKVDACYVYGTRATTQLCVRENLLTIEEGICKVTEDKLVQNSGGPIQIEAVKESALGNDKIGLTFTVKHAGQGSVYQKGSKCSSQILDKDRVYVKVDTGIDGLTCAGFQNLGGSPVSASEGYIKIFNGERIVNCQQPLVNPGDFVKVVEITAEYDYKQSITKTLTVKKSTIG